MRSTPREAGGANRRAAWRALPDARHAVTATRVPIGLLTAAGAGGTMAP
ncbi:MAG: hypothetical protein MZU84_00895 [Sphingobacterium sp.]|nr:hypothetical protein [Sphingobacterium sp.]